MNIQIIESNLGQWNSIFSIYPASERTLVSSRRWGDIVNGVKETPDFLQIWTVTGSTADLITTNHPDWITA